MNQNLKDLNALKKNLEQLKAIYHGQQGEQAKLQEQEASLKESVKEIHEQGECLEQVRLLLMEAAKHAREQGRRQVELLVTQGLQFVFGDDLEFKVVVEEKRDRPEAEFYVCSTYGGDYRVETTPQDARGGGVVDVISLALRLALLHASRPPVGGPAILDEPGKHVSDEYAPQLAQFLKGFSQSLGRQVIMVSHNQHLADSADISYLVELHQGISKVRRIR
ncbi:MAG: ATP-binding protein [Syntrophaceticus sp.]|nr:ATP-binding protein [Syntrophaceticus sp.]MDD3314473.1 ATP-binding protein [Syntrophaceticus sp.]MDD4359502.1 ATP-binding protein [Syntrophaceticus sp.]MDD4782585.1 ATP-binding protein [Syntrophaceticus sp.]HBG22785.1 ATPase [Peptococcaceae bacterium]